LRTGADGCRDGGASVLDQPARLTAFGMDRGRIAGHVPSDRHRLPGLGAQRRRRIPVEIDPVGHSLLYYLYWPAAPAPLVRTPAQDALSQLEIAPSLTIIA